MSVQTTKALRDEIRKLATEKGTSVLRELIAIVEDRTIPTKLRTDAAKALLPFLLPTLEQVQLTDADGENLKLINSNTFVYQELMKDAQARTILETAVIRACEQRREPLALPSATRADGQ